jgi:flagellar biosynthesis/type III secretory pathway protein FliH
LPDAVSATAARRALFPAFGATGAEARTPPSAAALYERARREGLEAGQRQGRSDAVAAAAPRLTAAVTALEAAAHALEARRAELAAELAAALPRIVLGLVERVLRREIAAEAPGAVAARAVAARLAGLGAPVGVRVSPAAAEALAELMRADRAPAAARVTIERDPVLGDADWVLDTGEGLLDGRLDTVLEELTRRLTEPGP